MSQPGEASPQTPGQPAQSGVEGAELARRMILAAEAASVAASSAAQTLNELKDIEGQNGSSTGEKAWYRLSLKPSVSSPENREAELPQWREWSWSLEQYLASMDPEFSVDMARIIRKNPHKETDMSIMHDSEPKRCTFLYSFYASLLRHRPLLLLKKIEGSSGFEVFRHLVLSMEPASRNWSLGILNAIMGWPQFVIKGADLSCLSC